MQPIQLLEISSTSKFAFDSANMKMDCRCGCSFGCGYLKQRLWACLSVALAVTVAVNVAGLHRMLLGRFGNELKVSHCFIMSFHPQVFAF